ncbi:MAG: hypothetical protein IIZ67_06525 [Bacilli bacterium]|nr:hypothetical protein [Bacilli bacterium]
MEIVLYIICLLVLLRYGFVLYKYLKTGKFKKKVYKGNIIGVIAYSFLTVLIICFLILMALVSKDKSSDLLMWIIFAAGLGTVVMYPWSWQQRIYDNARTKNNEVAKIMNEEFNNKYGNEEYDEFKVEHFNIEDNVEIDERFNSLISLITNNQISFIHPNQYKNIADVFANLYQQDYIKLLNGSESIDLTCEKVNDLLKKNNIDLKINSVDITKDDDEFIKARRKDFVPTMVYDLYKIDEMIKGKINDYELVAFLIYNKEGKVKYPTYLCIMQKSKYDDFFKVDNNEVEVANNEQ